MVPKFKKTAVQLIENTFYNVTEAIYSSINLSNECILRYSYPLIEFLLRGRLLIDGLPWFNRKYPSFMTGSEISCKSCRKTASKYSATVILQLLPFNSSKRLHQWPPIATNNILQAVFNTVHTFSQSSVIYLLNRIISIFDIFLNEIFFFFLLLWFFLILLTFFIVNLVKSLSSSILASLTVSSGIFLGVKKEIESLAIFNFF